MSTFLGKLLSLQLSSEREDCFKSLWNVDLTWTQLLPQTKSQKICTVYFIKCSLWSKYSLHITIVEINLEGRLK